MCDCHILWLLEILPEFSPLSPGSVTCTSSNPLLDGVGLGAANVTIIGDACPGEGLHASAVISLLPFVFMHYCCFRMLEILMGNNLSNFSTFYISANIH